MTPQNCRLRGQFLATLRTTCVQDVAASFGGHTCAETVAVLANAVGWLECALHCVSPVGWQIPQWDSSHLLSRSPFFKGDSGVCQRSERRNSATKQISALAKCYRLHDNCNKPVQISHPTSTRREDWYLGGIGNGLRRPSSVQQDIYRIET